MVPESSLMSVYRDINQSLTFVEACSPQHLTILMGGKKNTACFVMSLFFQNHSYHNMARWPENLLHMSPACTVYK